jgi:hypothetical protein
MLASLTELDTERGLVTYGEPVLRDDARELEPRTAAGEEVVAVLGATIGGRTSAA